MRTPKPPNDPNSGKRPAFAKATAGRPGYEHLACYQLGVVIQELTDEFCRKFLIPKQPKHPNIPNLPNPNFRQIQQMTQAARSIPQNIAEGYIQESLKGYIYLTGIARGSNEELTKDFTHFLKTNSLSIWPKDHPRIREFRAFRVTWISRTSLNTPKLPKDPTEAVNLLLTFCNMEGYLLKKLVASLEEKHRTEGGADGETLPHQKTTPRTLNMVRPELCRMGTLRSKYL
jgi:hypothetical protein